MGRPDGNLVCIDYETIDSRGASFEYFRDDFRILSLSCCWREGGEIKHWFSAEPKRIYHKLVDLTISQAKIVAQNLPYEMGVTNACHPEIDLNWYADTMRLSQIRDGGGQEFAEPELTLEQTIAYEMGDLSEKDVRKIKSDALGLSLEACAARFLPDTTFHHHKEPAHKWLEEHHGITKNHGRHLHLLPAEVLEQYNNADTLVTLLLYEAHMKWAKTEKIDWMRDHRLYLDRGRLITGAYRRGIKIDRTRLFEYILELEDEIEEIEEALRTTLADEFEAVKWRRFKELWEWANDPNLKSDRARLKRKIKVLEGDKDENWKHFNIGSSKQLYKLFGEVMGMRPKFLTKKGSPSFKTTHLHQWGEGGKILQRRRKRLLVLQQAVNTYLASEYDGRVHCSIKVSGTRTNRVAGGRI